MSQPKGSSTPKGAARMQTSIFSFFSTPKKPSTVASKTTNSQDALLDEIGAIIDDDDLLVESEQAEARLAVPERPVLAAPKSLASTPSVSHSRKRKASPALGGQQNDSTGSDTTENDDDVDDDDADDDYDPIATRTAGPGSKGRGRVVDDSDDDDDDVGDLDGLDDEIDTPSSPSHRARQRGLRASKGSRGAGLVTPNLKRMKSSVVASSASSEGAPLMSTLMPTTPTLARTTTSLSALSVASSGSTPLMQRMQLQAPPTADETKRARAAKFAKKNDGRYAWLVDVRDAQGVRPGEPGYDKRSLLIPRNAWNEFSAFEKQYWEIKGKHWDTVV
ncbi:DNA mismatch repair protein msh6, partial [Coemansia sp. RSA 25]